MDAPKLVDYWDHRVFLSDWFDWKKATNPRFSHRLFARLTGQSNPSLLLQIIQGKRNLTEATLEAYIQAIGFEDEDAEAFALLVRFNQADSADERTACFEALSAARRFNAARKIEGDSFRYLTRWYVVATRELALCPGFRPDPDWIARTLMPPISREQAEEALQLLTDLGMLVIADDGSVSVHEQTLATPHEVWGLAVYGYHRVMLDLARSCMDRVPPAERHVGAVTIAVPDGLVPALKAEVSKLQERLLDLADGAVGPSRVYQATLQLFPLSASVSEDAT